MLGLTERVGISVHKIPPAVMRFFSERTVSVTWVSSATIPGKTDTVTDESSPPSMTRMDSED